MASSSTPSSSITTLTKKHEVFLSFRGQDTRHGFTGHLYHALCRKQIETFIDDNLIRGDEISSTLLRAIEESKIAVVIFSENYASSKWCLRELAEIIKRMKLKELIVMPVFYHVDSSDVQELKGSYECSFANEVPEEVKKWREALSEASNQAGFDSSVIRPASKLVGEIVKAVWRELRSKYMPSSSDFEGLIGIHERIEQVKSLLCLDMDDVRIIGIWGMAGIGKTTIARAVFKSISYQFDGACIIEEVGKILEEKGGSDRLKLDVLSKVLHEENPKLDTPIHPFIMRRLNQKKVFVVLDGVNNFLQSKTLVGYLLRCGLGSRIIITSRDKQVLCNFNINYHEIYEVEGFNDDEALELLHKHANPTKDCMALSEKMVNYAKGNPLALEVLGLSLKGKSKQVWERALDSMQGIGNSEIFDVLKSSYDGLAEEEKNLFLDIACVKDLYNPLKNEALDCVYSLSVLIDKALVTIIDMEDYNYIEMHGLLQEMGREIVRRKSPNNLGNRSRLWERDDVIQILKYNTGTDAVEVISLHMDDIEEDIHLSSQVFDKTDNLRILFFHATVWYNKVHLPYGLNCFPNELRILHWYGYPLRALPSNFDPKKLVKLDFSNSDIEQLWEGTKKAPELKLLILSNCQRLSRIPNLSDSPLLVEVDLTNCKNLVGLTSSVHQLNNLRDLYLYGCNVTKFPLISGSIEKLNLSGTAIEEVPSSIQSLTNLTVLDLSKCTRLKHISTSICKLKSLSTLDLTNCSQLETFPEILETMEFLSTLDLSGSAIKELPPSIEYLNGLQYLSLSNCENLKMLPSSICNLTSLEHLLLSNCKNLEMLPSSICNLTSLKVLDLSACSKLDKLPNNLGNLKSMICLNNSGSSIGQLLPGWDSSVIRPDSKLVGEIGIHKRIEHVKSLLCLDMKDVQKINGIWGMGGVGKTTIARAVFESISRQFDGACFIEKVGKRIENGGSDRLQREVLSEVLHEENLKLGTPTICPFIMELLNQKKVFIVLDDVNDFLQSETLVECLRRCGLGSRIIITSKDKQVLCNFKVDDREIHEEKGLDYDEALELFRGYANPTEDCMALSKKIVNYAKGNPLALEVLGLSLKGMSKQVWESALKKLQGIVNSGIFDVLKISYDGLNEEEKKIFLDLACFGDLYNYHGLLKEEFLDCMHLEYSLSVLVAKSLITRHKRTGDIEMHDLLQEMGREVVRRESPNNPGKRSRLWERNDVIRTLEKNTGTDAVEVISLDMDGLVEDEDMDGLEVISLDMDGLEDEDIHLNSQVFDKMHNLRFLIFHSMYGSDKVLLLPNTLNRLPDELMFLHWFGYPLRVLPSNFNLEKLVKLDLSGSNIELLWEGTKRAPKLKWLNLSYCEHLTRIPNLSDFPLLVEVDLSHCESLVDFPFSVQQHNNLRNLNMSETAIEEVPESIQSLTNLFELKLAECTRLKHISTNICKLKSLSTLDLTDCTKLKIFPEILETMESLKSLKLSAFLKINMDLKVLPTSIERLNGLRSLTLTGCKNLEMLPDSICNLTSLEDLYLSYCSKPIKLPVDLGNLKSLKHLTVRRSAVGQLPSSITCLENLEGLDCSGCSLMKISKDIGRLSSLKKLELSENMFKSLPKSIKQLSKLEFLSLSHCNMLRSLPVFPEGLECLETMDCDQLCQVPDASEFVRCINTKSRYYHVDFLFTNSLNLVKVVSNVFEESLGIMQRTEKGSGKPPNEFSIYLPGNKIPEWFNNRSLKSSVNIKVHQNDLVKRKFMGFAICAVFGCDENHTRVRLTHGVGCVFETYYDHIKICNGNRIYRTHYGSDLPNIFIDSDHMLLGYCSFYSRNPIPAGDSDYVDISIEFKICDKGNQLKCCAVHPMYAEEPIEIIGATIQEIGETSGRRDLFDDNDEEVEPNPKRICTQEI